MASPKPEGVGTSLERRARKQGLAIDGRAQGRGRKVSWVGGGKVPEQGTFLPNVHPKRLPPHS